MLWGLKTIAIVLGATISIVGVMALVSYFTENLIFQLIVAVIIAGGIPLVLAARLGKNEQGKLSEGLSTDVLSVTWFGFALLFVAGAFPVTQPYLIHEADLLNEAGFSRLARGISWVARGRTLLGRVIVSADRTEIVEAPPPSLRQNDGGERSGSTPESESETPDGGIEEIELETRSQEEWPALQPFEIHQKLSQSLATLSLRKLDGSVDSATGIVIDSRGGIVTASRALEDMQSISLKLGKGPWLDEVWLAATDESRGLALLIVETTQELLPLRQLTDESEPGDRLYILGNPLGLEPSLAEAELLEKHQRDRAERLVLSAFVFPHALGGPVTNDRGELVGVVVAGVRREGTTRSRAVAVPVAFLEGMRPEEVDPLYIGGGQPPPWRW